MLWFWLIAWGPVLAADDVVDEHATVAEYNRLRHDLRRYAEKQMWTAVERTYERCLELYPDPESAPDTAWAPPTQMEQRDHLDAAHAAMSRGDLYATRQRVVRAVRKEQSAEALDWLWAIDTTYSEVMLSGPPGVELTPAKRPFDPVIVSAIDYATKQLAETGSFHGLLPRMPYRLGEERFEVRGGEGVVTLDVGGKRRKPKKKPRKE
ncbi:MAG: hypothetical protein H6736_13540 [Alphaproteobacteria bacterium]|nr:hypothetical protein [Alphaproteobacteria bacterium]